MSPRKSTKLWTMKDGTKIRICDMSDAHIINTMRILKRYACPLYEDLQREAQRRAILHLMDEVIEQRKLLRTKSSMAAIRMQWRMFNSNA